MDEDHFEEPILELERRIEALPGVGEDSGTEQERKRLEGELAKLRERIEVCVLHHERVAVLLQEETDPGCSDG